MIEKKYTNNDVKKMHVRNTLSSNVDVCTHNAYYLLSFIRYPFICESYVNAFQIGVRKT